MSKNPRAPPFPRGFPPPPVPGKMPPMPPFMPPGFIPPPGSFPMPPFGGPPFMPPFPGAPMPRPPPGWIPPPLPSSSSPVSATTPLGNLNGASKENGSMAGQPEKESDWTEHVTESGQLYWYNRISGASVWEKPDELKSEVEKAEITPWREYLTDDGRKYYHNAATGDTVWDRPKEYVDYLERLDERRRRAIEAAETPRDKMLKTVFPDEPLKNAFAHCLMDRDMHSSWSWDQCVSATFEDERSKALKMADRKQVYQLMVQKLRVFEVEERRRKERQQEEDFFAMLDTWPEQDRYTTYREMVERFETHQIFLAASERERARLFADYKQIKEKKERDKQKADAHKKLESFKSYLKDAKLSAASTWKDFREAHSGHELFQSLEPLDRLEAFAHHIRTLKRSEDDQMTQERRLQRVHARQAREGFRSLLIEKFAHSSSISSINSFMASSSSSSSSTAHSSALDSNTRWSVFRPLIANDPRYHALLTATGSTPAEIFYDYTGELHDKYNKEKRRIKNLARNLNLRVLRLTTTSANGTNEQSSQASPSNILSMTFADAPKLDFKSWAERLKQHISATDEHTLRRIYHDFGERELGKAKGRFEKAQKRFTDILHDKIEDVDSTGLEAALKLASAPEFDVLSLADKEALFLKFLDTVKTHGRHHGDAGHSSQHDEHGHEQGEEGGRNRKRSRHHTNSDDSSDSDGQEMSHSVDRSHAPSRKAAKQNEGETPLGETIDTVALPPGYQP